MKRTIIGTRNSLMLGLLTLAMICVVCGCKNKPTQKVDDSNIVVGIDVSEYQGQIEWDKLAIAKEVVDSCIAEVDKAALTETLPVKFVFIRATKSNHYVDKFFLQNFDAVRQQGICRGAYHFLTDTVSGKLQAENYINTVVLEEGDLPPVLDIEVLSPKTAETAKEWLSIVEANYGRQAIVYTNCNVYDNIIANDSLLNTRDLWLAQWSPNRPENTNCRFWQMSAKCKMNSISANVVDVNLFLGNSTEFKRYVERAGQK